MNFHFRETAELVTDHLLKINSTFLHPLVFLQNLVVIRETGNYKEEKQQYLTNSIDTIKTTNS